MMQLISPAQVTPAVRKLFDPSMPAAFRGSAVLNGTCVGKIWIDNPEQPSCCVVQEGAFGTLYLGGAVTSTILAGIVSEACLHGEVMIGFWPDDPRIELAPSPRDYEGTVLDFTDRPLLQRLDIFLHEIPEGCAFRRVDERLFRQSMDYEFYSRMFGSPEKAFGRLLGLFLMHGDEILCEAYAGVSADGIIEMGVNTKEGYRQRGYATLTCARLIHACEALGYQTYWNCNQANTASAALARRLGYRREREYRLLYWQAISAEAAGEG
jgi:RimJ/RimL family protein N-acetyltransferase